MRFHENKCTPLPFKQDTGISMTAQCGGGKAQDSYSKGWLKKMCSWTCLPFVGVFSSTCWFIKFGDGVFQTLQVLWCSLKVRVTLGQCNLRTLRHLDLATLKTRIINSLLHARWFPAPALLLLLQTRNVLHLCYLPSQYVNKYHSILPWQSCWITSIDNLHC